MFFLGKCSEPVTRRRGLIRRQGVRRPLPTGTSSNVAYACRGWWTAVRAASWHSARVRHPRPEIQVGAHLCGGTSPMQMPTCLLSAFILLLSSRASLTNRDIRVQGYADMHGQSKRYINVTHLTEILWLWTLDARVSSMRPAGRAECIKGWVWVQASTERGIGMGTDLNCLQSRDASDSRRPMLPYFTIHTKNFTD